MTRLQPPIHQLQDPESARRWCAGEREHGSALGFVPTMGALHEGHLELVRRAAAENDRCVVSVFVNPLQFNESQDFLKYPRAFESDSRLLEDTGCAMVFTGTLPQFFPGRAISEMQIAEEDLLDPGSCAEGLEGRFRPGHFRGVATIVSRLFELVQPARAYFGEKDYQQTLVVKDLAARRGSPDIVVCPTSREPSGLARSSRNERLSSEDRQRAAGIYRALDRARARWSSGVRDAPRLATSLRSDLDGRGLAIEYAEVRDPERWSSEPPEGELERCVALVAVRVGAVRLIDNLRLDSATLPCAGAR